ncbi:NADH-quinone oxidoreductase subunit C [Bdellovibrionota bacterium]
MGVRPQKREEKLEDIKVLCGESLAEFIDRPNLDPIFIIGKDRSHDIVKRLKEEFEYNFLSDLSAVDNTPSKPRFQVTYNLYSMKKQTRLMVKVNVDDGESVKSITDLWKGANWLEREVFDMFGITFDGHPKLTRLYLPDQFVGHPLRKEFPYNYRQAYGEDRKR